MLEERENYVGGVKKRCLMGSKVMYLLGLEQTLHLDEDQHEYWDDK